MAAATVLQPAYLRLLDDLVAFGDGDGRPIGEHFCRDKHPEHYTHTYVPSLDDVRADVMQAKFAEPVEFYHKVIRCFHGIRQSPLSKQDERYKDSLSIQLYFQAKWMVDPILPKLEEVVAVFDIPIQSVPPKPLTHSSRQNRNAGHHDPLLTSRYVQLLQTIATLKDKENFCFGKHFVIAPPRNLDHYFYSKVVGDVKTLSTILTAVHAGSYNNPLDVYLDCCTVFRNFQLGSPVNTSRWRGAIIMQVIMPRVWSSIPLLPEVPPVTHWRMHHTKPDSIPSHPVPGTSESGAFLNNTPYMTSGPSIQHRVTSTSQKSDKENTSQNLRNNPPSRLSSKVQNDEEILQIIAASPVFLARMARSSTPEQLHKLERQWAQDGSVRPIPLMFGQPDTVNDPDKSDYSYPGLPYLLDIMFHEQSSGIRVYPNKEQEGFTGTRQQWAEGIARSLFQPPTGSLKKRTFDKLCQELLEYSEDRHDQEIEIEINTSSNYLRSLQVVATSQNLDINIYAIYRKRLTYFYRVWHEQALDLLLSKYTDARDSHFRALTVLSQASAASALLAHQITVLEMTMNALPGGVRQLGSVFRTGMTAAAIPIPLAEEPPIVPEDISIDPHFRFSPYSQVVHSAETVSISSKIVKDARSYNRLTPQARDFVIAHITSQMKTNKLKDAARRVLLAFLSFYPDNIGLHIALSSAYTAKRSFAVQAHLCATAERLATAKGQTCSEALLNHGVAYFMLGNKIQAHHKIRKACEARPTNFEAIFDMLHLLTDFVAGSQSERRANIIKARQFGQDIVARMLEYPPSSPSGAAHENSKGPHVGRLPPSFPLINISRLQHIYLTLGSLALRAGEPALGLQDFARGVEFALCGPTSMLNMPISVHSSTILYTFKDLFQVINMHLQYLWLAEHGTDEQQLKYKAALLEATDSEFNPTKFRSFGLQCLAKYPSLLSSSAVPFPVVDSALPLLLLLLTDLGRCSLSIGQDNNFLTAPLALADRISLDSRKDADKKVVSALADLGFAICQVIEQYLANPTPNLATALEETTGFRPSRASVINLYYFCTSLQPNPLAMHNLALLCVECQEASPATPWKAPDTSPASLTSYDYAHAWMSEAKRLEPANTAIADALELIKYLQRTETES